MTEILIGEYIRTHRKKEGLTIEQLCEGICDISTLSRLERGKQTPSRNTVNAILHRLGLPESQFFALVSEHDVEIQALKKEIRADEIRFERAEEKERPQIREQAMTKLNKLKTLAEEDDQITRQYILSSEVTLGGPEGPYSPAQRRKLLLRAIRVTIPHFDLNKIDQFCYNLAETTIINRIANTYEKAGERKEAIDIYCQLLQSIEEKNSELSGYVGLFCLVAHNYALELVLDKQYEQALELAERGQRTGVERGNYQFLPGFIAIQAECCYYLGEREKSTLLYKQAYYIYKAYGDEHNLNITKQEANDHLGLVLPT